MKNHQTQTTRLLVNSSTCQLVKRLLTVAQLLFLFLAPLSAQDRNVTVKLRDATLPQLFTLIEQQTPYRFSYLDAQIDARKDVSIDLRDVPVSEVLDKSLLSRGLSYKLISETAIVVYPTPAGRPSGAAADGRRRVRGRVTDESGEPLAGVNVMRSTGDVATVSDPDGNFMLEAAPGEHLRLSYLGFRLAEATAGSQPIDIVMQEDLVGLDEVLVVGYGTIERRRLTSAIASVKRDDFVQGSTKSLGQLIKGKIAGLNITTPSGNPVGDVEILLRGTNSLRGSSTPLILIDGVPGDMKLLSPDDIASVDVLKDGSAAAIYGTRANNGVVLITTRQAAQGGERGRISYSGYVSTEHIARSPRVLTAADYRHLLSQGNGFVEENSDYGATTDWLDAITRTPVTHYHSVSLDWGGKNTDVFANLSTRQAQGVFMQSDSRSLTGKLTVNHYALDRRLKVNLNAIISSINYTTTVDGDGSFNAYAYSQALTANPTAPARMTDGSWCQPKFLGIDMATWENPLALLSEREGENKNMTSRLYGNITLKPVEALQLNLLLSWQRYNMTRGYYQSSRDISNTVYASTPLFASRASTTQDDHMLELTAQGQKTIHAHHLQLLGGYSYMANTYENFWMNNFDFPSDQLTYNNMALGAALTKGKAGMNSYKRSGNLVGFFARLNYSYDDRYLLQASIRHEGDSKFVGSTREWGMFPAVSAAWRVSKERFMQPLRAVDDLKLRVGYGVTGTAPSAYYQTIARLAYSGTGNSFYYDGEWVTPIQPANNANTNFTWEKKHEYNIGLDLSLLKGRIALTADYYNRRTTDLLWDFSVPVPPYEYGSTTANIGTLQNHGIETTLTLIPVQTKKVTWSSTILFSTNSNRLKALDYSAYKVEDPRDYFYTNGEQSQYTCTHRVKVGEPIGQIWGYRVVGITDDGNWLFDDPTRPGETFTATSEGISIETHGQVLGNSLPRYYLSFNNQLRLGAFDLSVLMRGAFDFQIINQYRLRNENVSNRRSNNKPLTAFDPVMGISVNRNPIEKIISYYVEKGDYWKVDNITLGYTLKPRSLWKINTLRVYASVDNALLFTAYKGNDPESATRTGLSPGIDYQSQYPTTRTYTLGLNLGF